MGSGRQPGNFFNFFHKRTALQLQDGFFYCDEIINGYSNYDTLFFKSKNYNTKYFSFFFE